jgi:hypothetical protein
MRQNGLAQECLHSIAITFDLAANYTNPKEGVFFLRFNLLDRMNGAYIHFVIYKYQPLSTKVVIFV